MWTGMQGIFLSGKQLRQLFHADLEGGLLLQRVTKNSPADRAGLRGGSIPALIGGRPLLLGGDLILQLGDQEACHGDCLVAAHASIQGLLQIPVVYNRDGKIQETTIDVSESRQNFLANPGD